MLQQTNGVAGDDFNIQYSESTLLSRQVMAHLTLKGNIVEDKSDDMQSQLVEKYDFKVNGKKVEFKADQYMHRTNRIALEMISNIQLHKFGWFVLSQAEIILFMDSVKNIVHRVNLAPLQELVLKHKGTFESMFTWTKVSRTVNYCGEIIFVPHAFLEKNKTILDYRKFRVENMSVAHQIVVPKLKLHDNSGQELWLQERKNQLMKTAS